MNAVAARLGSDIDHRVACTGCLAVENFVFADHAESKCVDQRIAAIAGLELGFAAQTGHAETVAVAGHAAHHAFDDSVILAHQFRLIAAVFDRPKAQRIHHRQRSRTHGKDVAQNPAHAGRRALKGLDVAGVVVALDLKGAGPAVAHVNDAGVLARPLDDEVALGGQPLKMHATGLIGAMLAPHDAVNAQLGKRGDAPQRLLDAAVLIRGNAVLGQQRRRNLNRLGNDCRGCCGHHDCLNCRTTVTFRRQRLVWKAGSSPRFRE